MTFKDLKGAEGVEKLIECVPHVDSIFSDETFVQNLKDQNMSWMDAALFIYKNHTESILAVIDILGGKPEASTELLTTIATVLSELFQEVSVRAFFISQCKKMRYTISAMASTEDEQSKDS